MHVFIGVLDKDFLVKLPRKSVSEYAIFKIFLGGIPPDSPNNSMLRMLIVLLHNMESKYYFNLIGN